MRPGPDRGRGDAHAEAPPGWAAGGGRARAGRRRAVGGGHRPPAQHRSARWRESLTRQRDVEAAGRAARPVRARSPGRSTTSSAARRTPTGSPLKDAAQLIAFAEDRAIFDGYAAAGIGGIRQGTSNPICAAGRCARLSGRDRPGDQPAAAGRRQRALLGRCSARTPTRRSPRPATTAIRCSSTSGGWSTTRSSGRPPSPARSSSRRAAATSGSTSARMSRSATLSHTDTSVRLYLQETFTFLLLTTEASVVLQPPAT